jgi:hypothetical protein
VGIPLIENPRAAGGLRILSIITVLTENFAYTSQFLLALYSVWQFFSAGVFYN